MFVHHRECMPEPGGRDNTPIPERFAAPLERLLHELNPGRTAFLLRANDAVPADWLTSERIENLFRQGWMETTAPHVWQLLNKVWAVSIRGDEGGDGAEPDEPANMIRARLLRDLIRKQLDKTVHPESVQMSTAIAGIADIDVVSERPEVEVIPLSRLAVGEKIAQNLAELNSLLEVILTGKLHSQYQPIVHLGEGKVLGYEALIRGPKGQPLQRPGAMFRAADKARMVAWYDLACQEQCFAQAGRLGLKGLLFVNMDAEGLAYLEMHERPISLRARDHGLTPAQIVIEVTERQTVVDFPRLMQDILHLREQGFQIAIDDAGTGYNSLHVIAEIRPDFIKIDRSLVRNLNVSGERRALLATLLRYAKEIGSHLLTEGIETRDELAGVIDIGVPYAQGYLLGRPTDTLRGVGREVREYISNRRKQSDLRLSGQSTAVGAAAQRGTTLAPDAPLSEAGRLFAKHEGLTSIGVVEDGIVRGLLMRDQFDHMLSLARSVKAADLLPDQPIDQWMQTNTLLVLESTGLPEAVKQATCRADIRLDTDIIVVRGHREYVGIIPIRQLLEMAIQARSEENQSRQAA